MGPQTFNVGDTVRRIAGAGNFYGGNQGRDRVITSIREDGVASALVEGSADWQHLLNLELVRRAVVAPRPFQVGDKVTNDGYEHVIDSIHGTEVTFDDGCTADFSEMTLVSAVEPLADWEAELLEIPVRREGQHGYATGDVVRRKADQFDTNSSSVHKHNSEPWTVRELDSDGWPVDPMGYYHAPNSVEMVTKLGEAELLGVSQTPDARPFQTGDVVHTADHDWKLLGPENEYSVSRRAQNGPAWRLIRVGRSTESWEWESNLTLVTPVAAPIPVAGGLNVGDITSLDGRETRFFRILGPYSSAVGGADRLAVQEVTQAGVDITSNTNWEYPRRLVRYRAAQDTPVVPRKIGETPEGDHIAIDDPRIAWIWADAAKVADSENWCGEYDKLANKLGAPGRKQKWSGSYNVLGTVVYYHDIEGANRDEAIANHKALIVAELTK